MIKNYSDHSANERTFPAWVRTAMAVVGFGLAASRLQEKTPHEYVEFSLMIAGALVILLAYLRMRVCKKRIDDMETVEDNAAMGDTLLILIIGSFFALIVLFYFQVA